MRAKGFTGIEDTNDYWRWNREFRGEKITLSLARELFDQDDRLIFLRKSDWMDKFLTTQREEYDELPF
jgi:hypothetical protein